MHDAESDHIAWFIHCTKHGKGSNWEGTSSGTEGEMLDELLGKVKSNRHNLDQIVMDHDTASNAIVCSHFHNIHITYCSNHSAKSFHYELNIIMSLSCKCKKEGKKCKWLCSVQSKAFEKLLKSMAGKP